MIRVLIADDHEVVRKGVRALLASQNGFQVCGEAVDGRDAVEKAKELKPDVVVMDISMPNLNGLEATRLIRETLPLTEVLILSQHEVPEMIREAFHAGARGYIVKNSIGASLPQAVEKVTRRESFVLNPQDSPANLDAHEILLRAAALERALRESEERFRSTFEQAAVGIAHVAPDGRWLRVNQKLCAIMGYTAEDLSKLTFQDITHPDDLAPDEAQAAKLASGELDHYSMEKRYFRKDGSLVWVNLTVSGLRDAGGKLKYFIAVVEDIQERKVASEASYRLAAIVESSEDVIVSKDLHGIIRSWNAAAERTFGYSAAEAIGRPVTIIIPPELRQEETQILQRLTKGERIEHFETTRVTKTGERLHVSLTISPIKDSQGRVIGASKIARNITERKRTEKLLRENQQLLRAAFAQTYSFLCLLAVDGTVLEANRAALEGTGFPRREVIGQKVWDVWWANLPEEQETLKARVAAAAKGLATREECSYALRDGSVRFADRTLNPVHNEQGEVIMLVASGLDVTEQRHLRTLLQERVTDRTRELEVKNLELLKQTDFVRELSARLLQIQDEERRRIARELHDSVGQMLAAASMNFSRLANEKGALSNTAARAVEENRALLEQISTEIRTISHLLHPPLLDEVGLQSALQWYIEGFGERSKISVDLDLPQDFGRLPRDLEITLFRIVQECLTNIHRHSESRTAAIRVSRSANQVRLEVKDEGKGMSPELQTTISSGQTAGVGMRGMRERLRQLGGQLQVQSGSGGTLIVALLPVNEAATKEAMTSAAN